MNVEIDEGYYKPEITEFRVGFSYEVLIGNTWTEKKVGEEVWDLYGQIKYYLDKDKLRVKQLDEADIVDLGYQPSSIEKQRFVHPVTGTVIVLKDKVITIITNSFVVSQGRIKNRYELEQELKRINFTEYI